jgi:microcompartment protein CcmK/EutM
MTLDPIIRAANHAATARIRDLAARLSDDALRHPVGEHWTVAIALAHLAFWDRRVLDVLDRTEVAGTVVATRRSDGIPGAKYLLVELCDQRGQGRRDYLVALDGIGAGAGELVMVTQGPSARQMQASDKKPVDALISGIVDLVDENGEVVFRK